MPWRRTSTETSTVSDDRKRIRVHSSSPLSKLNCWLDASVSECDGLYVTFPDLDRITFDPSVMGGKPCIRGMRVTVGTILGLIASGSERSEILQLYPYLEPEDITAALAYAAWRSEERELPVAIAK